MKIWLLWAWMVGMVLSQEALPWDYSSWTPIVQNCPSCREGKKVEIRQANLQQLQFNPQPLQQQKSIFPVKTTFTPKLEQISVKPLLVQQQKSIFPAKTTINPKLKPLTFRPLTVQPQKSVVPAKTTSIPKLDKALTKDTAAQSTSVQAQHSGVHQQQIFDHQQRAANQKQKTNVFSVPLVHSEQELPPVQLVYLPQGSINLLADNKAAKVLLPVQEIDFSDKVKRDQEGSLVLGGSPNAINNNLLMTLVTSKGREADAQAKLSLLEAALTSSQPNHQQDGRLPRIFIAPSHVPPPPGYVKIALVPQADAASQPRDSLPQTFLTPNAHNLSPGFVKLNLPHSVSHLSRDIPVVVPNDQVAPNPLGLPHLNPLVSRPDASLNIQTLDEVRQAKAISSNSTTVQIVSQGEQNFHSPPQTFSRPPPPRPTTPRVRPTPSAPQTTARPPPTQITARPPPTKTTARFPPTQTTARPQPTQTSARPPPPPPPPFLPTPTTIPAATTEVPNHTISICSQTTLHCLPRSTHPRSIIPRSPFPRSTFPRTTI
ncbi:unnamed protein product [Meganyctiphanes norvegica]|uniref:Uncharacterized protein n=1 Tax=Meganyctiphanes norvegica TaxID=48144 RepID=A0AAV2Q8Z8_MEGNR